MIKKIQGVKIFLSPIIEADISKYVEFMNDMEMSLLTGTFHGVYGVKEELEYFKPDKNKVQLAIHLYNTEETIGLVELMNISSINRSAEIGISIGEAKHRNKGYGGEAMKLMIEFGFLALNLRSIYLTTLDRNNRARRLYESLGFRLAGQLRKHRYLAGQYYDVVYMDLLKEEYDGQFLEQSLKRFL